MPIYEYLCEKCGSELEAAQKITDPPLAMHAECGGELKRLISNSSFHLKGSGWYVTDYPSESRKKATTADSGSGGGSVPSPVPASPPPAANKLI